MTSRWRRALVAASAAGPIALWLAFLEWDAAPIPLPRLDAAPVAGETAMPARLAADAGSSIAARPLFTPSRRPVAVAASSPQSAVPPSASLVAVILGPDGKSVLLRLAGGKTRNVAEGQLFEGWTVAEIAADHVLLRTANGDYSLTFPKRTAGNARP